MFSRAYLARSPSFTRCPGSPKMYSDKVVQPTPTSAKGVAKAIVDVLLSPEHKHYTEMYGAFKLVHEAFPNGLSYIIRAFWMEKDWLIECKLGPLQSENAILRDRSENLRFEVQRLQTVSDDKDIRITELESKLSSIEAQAPSPKSVTTSHLYGSLFNLPDVNELPGAVATPPPSKITTTLPPGLLPSTPSGSAGSNETTIPMDALFPSSKDKAISLPWQPPTPPEKYQPPPFRDAFDADEFLRSCVV